MSNFSSTAKHVSILGIALVLITEITPTVFSFSDVKSTTPYSRAINALEERGVVEGYSDGTFGWNKEINRAEFLKITLTPYIEAHSSAIDGYQWYARGVVSFRGERNKRCFPDVSLDDWFGPYVCEGVDLGIISGYPDGFFRPERTINFAEASKILSLAFGQEMQMESPDWYEPYVRALEGSKAIPPSIEQLDAKVTRGEMAEMLWRLTENVTDEPSKAYLNVKYPEMRANLASDTPQRAESCADLQAFREEAARSGVAYMKGGEILQEMPLDADARAVEIHMKAGSAAQTARSYSETNVQVAGVDEGDIVKTDGAYLYIVNGQNVRIVRAHPASQMSLVATINLAETNFSPQDLYIDGFDGLTTGGNRLVVIGSRWESDPIIMEKRMMAPSIWPGPYPYRPPRVEVRMYDVGDKAKPSLERTVALEGNMVSSRRIGDRLYLVANQSVYWGQPVPMSGRAGGPIPLRATEEDLLPKIDDSAEGEEVVAPCDKVVILPHIPSPEYLTVAVIPLENKDAEVKREVVLGSAQNIYASLENLYVATTEWRYSWGPVAPGEDSERTNIYRFNFTAEGVSFAAKGSVPGHILNQFSMDEHESSFRIATTRNQWNSTGESRMDNNLYVLNHDMEIVGKIEEIAPGEQIYSVRFLGDRAYMVTFRTIDPLFVIDTSDPRNPRILGKLKIPGFSNYLHPYDATHILGFGKEAVESKDGTFAWQQGMKIALFDVSDVENPEELHRVVIGDRGTDSPLLSNHKALLFDRERNLLAFPVSIFKLTEEQKKSGDPGSAWGTQVFQGAHVYDLTLDDGFDLRGTITHYSEEDRLKAGDMWYAYGRDVARIVRIDDSLLTISQGSVQSHHEETVESEGKVELPL